MSCCGLVICDGTASSQLFYTFCQSASHTSSLCFSFASYILGNTSEEHLEQDNEPQPYAPDPPTPYSVSSHIISLHFSFTSYFFLYTMQHFRRTLRNINNVTSSTRLNDVQPPHGQMEGWRRNGISPKHVFGHFFWHWYFYYYLIYSLIINIMAYTTTGRHDDTMTQIHDDTTTRQKPPPHGHTQGWRSDIETGGRLQRREMAQTTMDTSFGPYGECIFFFHSFLLILMLVYCIYSF